MRKPDIESAKIITVSTAHLHPETISMIEKERGDLPEGPSIALREEGFLVNSHLGVDDALKQDLSPGLYLPLYERAPDLVLLRALARGLKAEWINIDYDGVEYADILPRYGSDGYIEMPYDPNWQAALERKMAFPSGAEIVQPVPAVLSMIEAGQTPHDHLSREVLLDYPAYRDGKIKLYDAPSAETRHDKAEDWVKSYGAMVSYESALDAAGYARERDMRKEDAPVFVTLAKIYHDGSMQVLSLHHGLMTISADELCEAHGVELPGVSDDIEDPAI
jgi:hypothetical protein